MDKTSALALAPLLDALGRAGAAPRLAVRLSPNARPWLAAALARLQPRPVLWLLPDERSAEDAAQAASFYLGATTPHPTDPFANPLAAFPLHQSLPYEELSPDREALAERLSLLFRLTQGPPPRLIVASVPAVLRLSLPRQALAESCWLILQGQELDREALARNLVRAGYLNVPLVEDPGTFAFRGGILDIHSPLLPDPVRIELLGNEVESLRTFDPATQRTLQRLESVYLGPVREILQDEAALERALSEIDRLAGELDLTSGRWLAHRRALREGVRFFGIEALLPAFHPGLESLLDYLPESTLVLVDDPGAVRAEADACLQRARAAYTQAVASGKLAFPPQRLDLSPAAFQAALLRHPQLVLGLCDEPVQGFELPTQDVAGLRARLQESAKTETPAAPLTELLAGWRRAGVRPFLVATRPGRARELSLVLRSRGLAVRVEPPPFDPAWIDQQTPALQARIVPGELGSGFGGFCFPDAGVGFLPDAEVFGPPQQARRRKQAERPPLSLKEGELVVHVDFGIGRFEGLKRLQVAGSEADYLHLGYRGGDRLYLPVTRMNLLERYRGPEGVTPPLSKLGGTAWENAKIKVKAALLDMADELVRLEALRRARPGLAVQSPGEAYRALEASFAFEETEDQARTIQEVVSDLVRPQAMDRLVCGDVGFGKTEVAVRAAFLKALSGQQTAVLVPTTILALQHLATFRARLQEFATRVEMVCRLTPAATIKGILRDAQDGKVDVLIGTHRLLREDVHFKSLGLVIVDEEHRFGVLHKERLKGLKHEVDVLTMSATPLPRTLQLSMSGLRDVSVIHTPPPGRRSIRTFVTRFSTRVIVEAIRRERERGGQVFFVHNWARSLPGLERFLNRVVPEVRTAVAHGQMHERKLEAVMSAFVRREVDLLVCTSIIESGLDIPSANTILVNRADMFGLAQLYQIRGRVGRSGERAYAYFLTPGLESITADARRRLQVLAELHELGSGYRVASEDLELRGAGNLLGKDQSGHIATVGFELYSRLLERAVAEVRGQAQGGTPEPEVRLPVAGYLPEDYVPDLDQRLDTYARLSRASSDGELSDLEGELQDRFGPAPPEVVNLCALLALKLAARDLGIQLVEFKQGLLHLQFCTGSGTSSDPRRLVEFIARRPERYALAPSGLLRVRPDAAERSELTTFVNRTLSDLRELARSTP